MRLVGRGDWIGCQPKDGVGIGYMVNEHICSTVMMETVPYVLITRSQVPINVVRMRDWELCTRQRHEAMNIRWFTSVSTCGCPSDGTCMLRGLFLHLPPLFLQLHLEPWFPINNGRQSQSFFSNSIHLFPIVLPSSAF